jgi:deazaflavin-dependent oxidoreductase (nitroreductase family)
MAPPTSLCDELGFAPTRANAVQRAMQRVGMTRAGSWVFSRTLYRVDRPLHRWSSGRITVPGIATGLPVIMLTTTGARSGHERTMPLAGIPDNDTTPCDILLMGTNYAQASNPAWVYNLEANPRCLVGWRDRTANAVAHPVTGPDERDAAWARASSYYAGFAAYRQRIDRRHVRIFRLARA